MKRKLNSFIKNVSKLSFGDYILFQEYSKRKWDEPTKQYIYEITDPILAIYIGWICVDQTIGFEYILWHNNNKESISTVLSHIEWNDYIDILGHWSKMPNWKEIKPCWKNRNFDKITPSENIDWSVKIVNI